MKLIHRVAYYLGGFVIGIIILLFFLGGKRASCDYGPTARTLKNIRTKERIISEVALAELRTHKVDTSAISNLLLNGNVLFSESKTDLDSCNIYSIEGSRHEENGKKMKITVENCENKATVLTVTLEDN
jgi:hypothetical protein